MWDNSTHSFLTRSNSPLHWLDNLEKVWRSIYGFKILYFFFIYPTLDTSQDRGRWRCKSSRGRGSMAGRRYSD